MNEECFYRVSVKGIAIDKQGRVLLAREEDDMWEMLGGGLEHQEDPIESLKREVLEETGLKITNISTSPKYFITAPASNGKVYMANVVYEIELESMDFIPSYECQELRFFSIEEMKKVKLLPNVKKLLNLLEKQQN
ncbi:MAG TPA: NUDIX hydrolase [Candidatus Saccharibacteria bacterium]|nr:NUDIX hydrolase [Candidatus Saccharibacteria bacterium]HMT39612.1 NUDIX hydrolase [Candidatus Saccharibacteria bacterium]